MKRIWFLLLFLSLGLNAGLLYALLTRPDEQPPPARESWRVPRGGPGTPEDPEDRAPRPDPDRLERILSKRLDQMSGNLHLDPEQYAKVESILRETLPLILAEQRQVWDVRRAMRRSYQEGEFDPAGIRIDLRRMHSAQARLDSLVILSMTRETSVLTAGQRSRYLDAMPWHSPMERSRGPGMPHRGRPWRGGED